MSIKRYDFDIVTLSPIHIGSGENYNSSEYVSGGVRDKNGDILPTFRKINLSKYYSSLSDDKKDELLEDLSNENFNLKSFDSKIPNDVRDYTSYNKCKQNPNENQFIEENIKSLNSVYIPGSSIKGAIKTALLYNSIDLEDIPQIISNLIKRGRINRWDYENFINDYFSSDSMRNKAQGSIMKFMQVSDSNSLKNPSVYDVISIMATDNNSTNYYKRNGTVVRSFLETIRPKLKLKSSLTTNFDSKIYSTLNLDDYEYLIDIDYIKESIFNFSNAYINYELEFSEKYGIAFLNKFYKNILSKNSVDTPLLKIGAGSGFLATTIGLKIKEYDDVYFTNYFDEVRQTLRTTNYPFEFPKSRKITAKGAMPLGWTQLRF